MNITISRNLVTLQHKLLMSLSSKRILDTFSKSLLRQLALDDVLFIRIKHGTSEVEKYIYNETASKSPKWLTSKTIENYFSATLPPGENDFIEQLKIDHFYLCSFALKDLGYFILAKKHKKLDPQTINALKTPFRRFTHHYLNQKKLLLGNNKNYKSKKVSRKLRIEKLKFKYILGAINDGVVAINQHKEIFFGNTAAQLLLGFDEEKPGKKPFTDYFKLYSIDGKTDITEEIESAASNNQSWLSETPIILRTSDGKELIVELSIQKIKDQSSYRNRYTSPMYFVVAFHDVTERYEMQEKLAWQATHDPLTRALNRLGFENNLQRLLLQKTSYSHALIYIDLDRFKQVNDLAGHMAGDALLQNVCILIKQEIRETDLLARVGGDEFCILLNDCETSLALDMAERIRKQIDRLRFKWEENIFTIGVSIGISEISPDEDDADKIFTQADEACRASKENGRNQITLANYAHLKHTEEFNNHHLNFLDCINKSLSADNNQFKFVLYHQDVKSTSESGGRDHIEILLRMEHKGKIILPNSFLPIAERYGKICDIDLWVIKNSLEYIKKHKEKDVNVNLSGVTLSDDKSRQKIFDIILNYPYEAKHLCIEITETAAITNLGKCIEFMESASKMGVSFALDDFGTGVSSFGYLKSLPIKYLKIDGSFIRDICKNEIDEILVKSINQVAKAMSIQTVAEYVENEKILDKVSELGIDFVQGHHLNHPTRISMH